MARNRCTSDEQKRTKTTGGVQDTWTSILPTLESTLDRRSGTHTVRDDNRRPAVFLSQMLGSMSVADLSGLISKAEPSMTKSTRTRTRTEREQRRTLLRFKASITGRRRQRQEQACTTSSGHRFRYAQSERQVRGATPSMALNKAARRIHKKNPSSCSSRSSCAACLPSTLSVSSTCTM
jgi:hypothetical protein